MTIKEYKAEYTYLGIAAAGVYAKTTTQYNINSTITSSVTIYDNRLSPYYGDVVEGGIIVDKRPCINHEEFYKMVINGPMLKMDLPNQTVELFTFPATQETIADARNCGSCDNVSLDLYIKLWKELGAKVGYRRGNVVEWDNGEKSVIPEARNRFITNE